MMITGSTRLFGIVADPIAQVRTPEVLNAYFEKQGLDAVLVPMHIDAAQLPMAFDVFRALKNLGGFIVTVPHKTAAVDLCDEVSAAAREIGAVNTVRREPDGRLVGDMFDGRGFVAGLKAEGLDPAGRRALLVGAGGAAAAIAFALAEAGVGRLTIANRTRARAEELASRVSRFYPAITVEAGDADPRGHELIVNSTSLGMKAGDALPFDTELLQPEHIVAEIIMKPEMTAMLQQAKLRGCVVQAGRHMLDHQARLMGEFMTRVS